MQLVDLVKITNH